MTPREKIRALLEGSRCCCSDAPHYECCVYEDPDLKPGDLAICGESKKPASCRYYQPAPCREVVQSLTPVLMGLMELWAEGEAVAQAYRALEATYWMGEETEDTRPAAKAMDVAFRAFATRLLALNARASEALGEVSHG